jgi:hypothetical protein
MIDWSGALTRAFQEHLANGGSGGSSGSDRGIPNEFNHIQADHPGTTPRIPVVPLVPGSELIARDGAASGTTGTTQPRRVVPGGDRQEHVQHQTLGPPGTTRTTGTTEKHLICEDKVAEFAERAAIVEFEAGVPREWAEGLTRLGLSPRPNDFPEDLWRQLIDDCGRFIDRWAAKANRLGWSAVDVFGVQLIRPQTRYEAVGLVHLIRGGEILDIGSARATIRTGDGRTITYLRRAPESAIAVWQLVGPRDTLDMRNHHHERS